jgi:hypothetical protein
MADRYILEGHEPKPCEDLMEWARWFEAAGEKRIVAQTEVGNDVKVSTVFLGLNHSWDGGPPLLFETMIFGQPDSQQERCSTWEQAEKQHARIVELAKAVARA